MSNVKAQAVAVALLLGYATLPNHADAAPRPNVEITATPHHPSPEPATHEIGASAR